MASAKILNDVFQKIATRNFFSAYYVMKSSATQNKIFITKKNHNNEKIMAPEESFHKDDITKTEEMKTSDKLLPFPEEEKNEIINGIEIFYNDSESCVKCKAYAKDMSDGTRKADRILAKFGGINSLNDTGKINFYEGKEKIPHKMIKYLSEYFCDNILLYIITERDITKFKTIDDNKGKLEIVKFLVNFGLVQYEDFKLKSLRILSDKAEENEDKKTKKFLNSLNKINPMITKEQKELYCKQNNRDFNEKINLVKQIYKIGLSNVALEKVLHIFDDNNLKYLATEHNIHFYDIDITRDIAGAMHKDEIIKYMSGQGYFLQHTENNMKQFNDYALYNSINNLQNGEKLIQDNDKTVGKHCLTFYYKRNSILMRCKLYNKFVCSLESGSVDNKIGCKLYEFIYNNKDKRLYETIKKSLNDGLLRLEVTYSLYIPTMQDIIARKYSDRKYRKYKLFLL